ncbi:MAG: cysteine desulfurase family protein [Planctomycetota bacterium]
MPIYLDNNATTKPCDEAIAAAETMMHENWHNPSSVHRAGQEARYQIELARKSVASLVGARARQVTFTSGATESIDLAIRGVLAVAQARSDTSPLLLTTALEHEAVRDLTEELGREGTADRRLLTLDRYGRIDAQEAVQAISNLRPAIVSVQWANNETGVIQPIREIGRACREAGSLFHTDATQWVGKLPCAIDWGDHAAETNPDSVPIDLLSLSAHKFHGIKGAGALVTSRRVKLKPRLLGAQELGRRAGTEATLAIAAMGTAADAAQRWMQDPDARAQIAILRDRLEQSLLEQVPGASINGVDPKDHSTPARLWNTTNIAFPGVEAEALLLQLSERGVYASAGAACSSGSLDPSPVLLAMGIDETLAHGSVRFSLSRHTTRQEVDQAIPLIVEAVKRVQQIAPIHP